MTLGNMRANGVRSLDVSCWQCHHELRRDMSLESSTMFIPLGDGQAAAELARLKGQMEALEQASVQKNCGIQFRQQASRAPQ